METVAIRDERLDATPPSQLAKEKWDNREWYRICEMLEESRKERTPSRLSCPFAGTAQPGSSCPFAGTAVPSDFSLLPVKSTSSSSTETQISFDTSGTPLLYEAGDCIKVSMSTILQPGLRTVLCPSYSLPIVVLHVQIVVRNSDDMISKVLGALGMESDDAVQVNPEWQDYLLQFGDKIRSAISADDFLARATVRPLTKNTATAILETFASVLTPENYDVLEKEIEAKIADYELWDFLQLMKLSGLDDMSPLKAVLPDVLVPLMPRHYSIASCPEDELHPDKISIVVGSLKYETKNSAGGGKKRMSALQFLQAHRSLLGKSKGKQEQEQAREPEPLQWGRGDSEAYEQAFFRKVKNRSTGDAAGRGRAASLQTAAAPPPAPTAIFSSAPMASVRNQAQTSLKGDKDKPATLLSQLQRKNGAGEPGQYDTIQRRGTSSSMIHNLKVGDQAQIALVPGNRAFRMPTDRATPIIFVALGSGIAPCISFVNRRVGDMKAGLACGEIWVFWGVAATKNSDVYLPELMQFVESGHLNLVISFSREDCHTETEATGNASNPNKFTIKSGNGKQHVGATILSGCTGPGGKSYREEMSRLLQMRACMYLCGPPDLLHEVRRMVEVVSSTAVDNQGVGVVSASAEQQKIATEHFYHLVAEERIRFDLFSSNQVGDGTKSFVAHDVARHHTLDDCWVIFKGKVFDITHFLCMHRGGHKLLLNYAGRDMTDAFCEAHGDDNYRVEMLLTPFYIGEFVNPTANETSWVDAMNIAVELNCMLHNNILGTSSAIAAANVVPNGLGLSAEGRKRVQHAAQATSIAACWEDGLDLYYLHELVVAVYLPLIQSAALSVCQSPPTPTIGLPQAATAVMEALTKYAKKTSGAPEQFGARFKQFLENDSSFCAKAAALCIRGAEFAQSNSNAVNDKLLESTAQGNCSVLLLLYYPLTRL
jgi:sulfite reductase alpha subunit-like flavoprotein/cytochrome b involved in lipid metabolism